MTVLLARIAKARREIDEIERALRAVGAANKEHGRQIARLRESANDLEIEVRRALSEVKD